jgi:hypothetical protein
LRLIGGVSKKINETNKRFLVCYSGKLGLRPAWGAPVSEKINEKQKDPLKPGQT